MCANRQTASALTAVVANFILRHERSTRPRHLKHDMTEPGAPHRGKVDLHSPRTHELVLREARGGVWLHFHRPRRVLQTTKLEDVMPLLDEISALAKAQRLYAAGFISYEAAPAFDAALDVQDNGQFPLIWFGLYDPPQKHTMLPEETDEARISLPWRPNLSQKAYNKAIKQIKDLIAAGRTYQVNFSLRLQAPFIGDSWRFFRQLVQAQKAPYGAYLDIGRHVICCASPELFFRLEDGRVTARPMKGTAPRGLTWEDDEAQAIWLHNSEKNRAENVMIVDMIRNDLGRVAKVGTVDVPSLFNVEKYPSVWQMTSTVTAQTDKPLPDLLKALFPCASITGAPKHSTMQIIADLEKGPRRIYTGSIGYMAPDGSAQFNVAIRTVLVDRQATDTATGHSVARAEYGVGGGVVWDSSMKGEWEECATKARILTIRRPSFQLLETLRWTRDDGYSLLTQHLARLLRSADYFGFAVDSDAVMGRLRTAAQEFTTDAYRLRLLLSKDGSITVETTVLEIGNERGARQACLAPSPINTSDVFLYHKTTNRGFYEEMLAACRAYDDVILWNKKGEITEACLANIVAELDGDLITPPVSCGLLAGTYRAWMLQQGLVRERVVRREDLQRCTGLWLVNSVRGRLEARIEDATLALETI